MRNPPFVESAILELLEKQLINEHSFPPHCVNPLTVVKDKKLRLVLDLCKVNKYLVKAKFRYEDLRSLSEVFEQGFWFFTWVWIFLILISNFWALCGILRELLHILCLLFSLHWIEHRMFLLYQAFAPFG